MTPARFLLAAALALSIPATATAVERGGVSMEVQLDGRAMTEHRSGSRSYVEAKKARNYTIVLRNSTSARVAVALAVDGLNSIDAKHTAAIDGKKWVLGPYETATIAGWQVDGEHARKFVFTSEEKSYGAWIGQTTNLGVISAVFYAEKPGPVCCYPTPRDPYGRYDLGGDDADGVAELESGERRSSERSSSPRPAPTAGASKAEPASEGVIDTTPRGDWGGGALSRGDGASSGRGGKVADRKVSKKKDEERAATGMGARTKHHVEWVAFDLDPTPLASFDVRYAFRDELVALGIDPDWPVITPAIERREHAQGFAPDPGHACCR